MECACGHVMGMCMNHGRYCNRSMVMQVVARPASARKSASMSRREPEGEAERGLGESQ